MSKIKPPSWPGPNGWCYWAEIWHVCFFGPPCLPPRGTHIEASRTLIVMGGPSIFDLSLYNRKMSWLLCRSVFLVC